MLSMSLISVINGSAVIVFIYYAIATHRKEMQYSKKNSKVILDIFKEFD